MGVPPYVVPIVTRQDLKAKREAEDAAWAAQCGPVVVMTKCPVCGRGVRPEDPQITVLGDGRPMPAHVECPTRT